MRHVLGTALAVGVGLALASISEANDVVRLGGPSAQAAIQGGTDTELVHWRGYRGYYGGYRGFHGGHRGYYGGYYGGYRGYYGGGYGFRFATPYVSFGYYSRPHFHYRPYYASYYQPFYASSYYYPSYYYSYPSYYYPCAGEELPAAQVMNLQSTYQAPLPRTNGPTMPPAQGDGTFPYDGGPRAPVPMPAPQNETNPTKRAPVPNAIVPLDGRLVSLQSEISGGTSAIPTPILPTQASRTAAPRVTFPAYGEDPFTAVPRKR